MLVNVSYNNKEITRKVDEEVGQPFTLKERWAMGGIGSLVGAATGLNGLSGSLGMGTMFGMPGCGGSGGGGSNPNGMEYTSGGQATNFMGGM